MTRCIICNDDRGPLAQLPQYGPGYQHCRDKLFCATAAINRARADHGACPVCGRLGDGCECPKQDVGK